MNRMNDLISRKAAIDGKISIQLANGVEIYSDEAVPVGYLKRLPTIQLEPHEGYWIKLTGMMPPEYFGKHECSECKYLISGLKVEEYYYCPNCGAKMRRENC